MIPQVQSLDGAKRDVLPLGRYLGTLDELKSLYVPENDDNRKTIWNAFEHELNEVREALGSIASVWIGGSFITSEKEPHDIDVVFFITQECFQKATSGVARFALATLSRIQGFPPRLDPLVDGYLMVVPPTGIALNNVADTQYAQQRGYWDQFWSKTRFQDPNDDRWHYPAAGYVEVIVDGYDIH